MRRSSRSTAWNAPGSQRLKRRALLGEMFGDNTPGRGVDAHIGDLVEPLTKLRIEIVEIAKAAAEEEVLADVAERALDLALRLGPIRLAGLGQVAVVAGERRAACDCRRCGWSRDPRD